MTKPNSSEIIVVLDRSGSMRAVRDDMAGGFETFIEAQTKVPGECRVSLFQFDDVFEPVYIARPLAEVPHLTLVPRGNTALWDAAAKAIVITGERFAKMPEEQRPEKVIFVVITDGQENASREYDDEKLRAMITLQEKDYSWQFMYLGSSLTTMRDAAKIGINVAAQYVNNSVGVRSMNSMMSNAIASYRSGSDKKLAYVPEAVEKT